VKAARAVRVLVAAALVVAGLPPGARGQGAEIQAMITELRPGRGRVEVQPAGRRDWRPAGPLQALRAGDAVRASEDASAIVLLSGGRGSVKVTRASSPYAVPGPQAGESQVQKALSLLETSLGFLSASAREEPRATLSTRGARRPPVILAPRNGPVLPGAMVFEWRGSRAARSTVRVAGPKGVLFEAKEVPGGRLEYPGEAPVLAPGIRYRLQVVASTHPPEEAWFEVLDAGRARAVRQDLADLAGAAGAAAPANTRVALQAGLLASRGLLHDARRLVVGALASDPDEPALHLLLARIYEKVGLPEQAAEALEEARALTGGR
jgi:hypothetical protein